MGKRYPILGLVLIAIGTAGLILLSSGGAWGPSPGWRPMMGPGMMGGWAGSYGKARYSSNGERIYYTGVSDRAGPIPASGGPMWLGMRGGGCVGCHGVRGRGGVPVMMGGAVPSDIRYEALTREAHREGEGAREHPAYTDALVKRAITEGLDPAGNSLDWTMPRWRVTAEDLDDLVAFLKTL
ncbi:MAG: c-type cytochrome [Candidatus Rokubacteria bacterium]|nr:c-type cytochrome [Candidatus Rokubacteria bacterium]